MKSKARIGGFGLSAAICILLNGVFTVLKEGGGFMKEWLTATFGSHWVGQAVVVLGLFLVLGVIFSASLPRGRRPSPVFLTRLLVSATAISFLLIVGFFLIS